MRLFTDFKNLPKGIKRTIIIGSIVLPLIVGGLMTKFDEDEWLPVTLIICIPVYWVLTLAGVWIYEGFKEDKVGQK